MTGGARAESSVTGRAGPYLLAVDAGTGSCRALLFTAAGEQVAVSFREWTHREPPGVPGGQDFDVEANWLAIAACIRDALHLAGASGDDVAAVAATSMREGIVLYDRTGTEIWACPNVDSRAAREAADLIGEGAAERIFDRGRRLGIDYLPGPAALAVAAPAGHLRPDPQPRDA